MYKRHTGQLSLLEHPEMFGSLPLNPNNEWVKLSRLVPWYEFDQKYAQNFRSRKGQRACDSRLALGSILIKIHYKAMSDEELCKEIAMNPYLQFFLGLPEYRYECPFDASMMTRFRQRISSEMLSWVNDVIIGRQRKTEQKPNKAQDNPDSPAQLTWTAKADKKEEKEAEKEKEKEKEETNTEKKQEEPRLQGTLILDATCAPQNIRFPTDVSLLNDGRKKAEETIDILHKHGLTDGKKPRTYRRKAMKKYNSFSKTRKKSKKMIRDAIHAQLGFLRRDLQIIAAIDQKHGYCIEKILPPQKYKMLEIIRTMFSQQETMYLNGTHTIDDRIVSLSQPWIRPIVRGKQNAKVEFGAKIEMSVSDGYIRIEDLRWDSFNESTTFVKSVEDYAVSYGYYPKRVLADTIFKTQENIKYCKKKGIHLNGPKLGKPNSDPLIRRQQKRQEWLESGERGEIERAFGVGKRRYGLNCIVTKLKETSEVMIHAIVLYMNLRKKLRLLLCLFFRCNRESLQYTQCSVFEAA